MGLWRAYRLRLRRRRWRFRAFRKRRELSLVQDRTPQIAKDDILLVSVLRDERARLPYFLDYYRKLGVGHFLMIDNGSQDGSAELLSGQPDVSLWHTDASYRKSRFGVDWVNHILAQYGHQHWVLCVDLDELFVYPFCDVRPLRALTDWLDASDIPSFGAMLLDMYPQGALSEAQYREGQDPLEIVNWFDSGNYTIRRNSRYGNLWIQGGPRARNFFADNPQAAPALNKTPLVKWRRGYAFASSTHTVLPGNLNVTYETRGGEKASGVLLHTKFLDSFITRAETEATRGEHYAGAAEYRAYAQRLKTSPELWCKWSEKYVNWRQLEVLGLMSKGNWA